MKKTNFLSVITMMLTCIFLTHCSSDNDPVVDNPGSTNPTNKDTWVIYNGNNNWSGGIYTLEGLPQGEISLAGKTFYQLGYSAGGTTLGKNAYRLGADAPGTSGITKFSLNNSTLSKTGFLSTVDNSYDTNYLIVSDTEGYYWDLSKGGMKVQKFNPTSMERTGEIDFSQLSEGSSYEAVGQLILAKRDNKLYADLQIGKKIGNDWQITPNEKKVAIVVYDLTTNKIENVTKFDNATNLGLFTDFAMSSIDPITQDLYVVATGNMKTQDLQYSSKILRIKKGQTTFDSTFSLDIKSYQFPAEFNRIFAYDSKIYTTIPSRAASYYGGGQHGVTYRSDIWYWNQIDTVTKKATRLDIPVDNYTSYQNPFLYEDKIYFISNNNIDNFSGLSSFNPKTKETKIEFKLKESGRLMGVNVIKN